MLSTINKKKAFTLLTISAVIIFIISLIPIFIASFYAHPVTDDLRFSALVHKAILNGGGFFDVISASCQQVVKSYYDWQGTFSAIFIFSLQPGVFSDNLYCLTTFIMVFALTFSTYFFIDTIVSKLLKQKRIYSLFLSVFVLFFSIQFMYDKQQGLFWFNGSSYYTLFYAFALVFFAILIRLYLTKKTSNKIILFILSLIFAIILGGGNYSTALITSCIMFLVVLGLFLKKDKLFKWFLPSFVLLIGAFIISIVAPGNAVRGALLVGYNPIQAIVMSPIRMLMLIAEWTRLPQIAAFIFVTPLLYKMSKKTNLKFNHPFLVAVFSFLIFCTQITPPLYAMRGSGGAGRQVNIYYYAFYLFVMFNIFYICGWLNKKDGITLKANTFNFNKIALSISACLIILIGASALDSAFVQTSVGIINGSVQQYDKEYKEIIEMVKAGEPEIPEISTNPRFFHSLGFHSSWGINDTISYFGVKPFKVKER